MFKKIMMVLTVFLVCLLAISAVSAETDAAGDIAGTDISTDAVDSTDGAILGSSDLENDNSVNEPASGDADSGKLDMGEGEVLADDIYVTGDNFTDISEAIDNATDGDIIYLQGKSYTGNGSQIVIDKELTIIGGFEAGDGIYATLDAQQLSRIFEINKPVTLQGIKFINGNSNYGGAIYVNEKCILIDCIFTNNRATHQDDETGKGGAVYWADGTVSGITNCTFENNRAEWQGGAIYFAGYATNLNADFINNSARYEGGANYIYMANNVVLTGNFIDNRAGFGGGANWFSKRITNVTLAGNFTGNHAEGNGGANAFDRLINVNITGTFTGNHAEGNGGANYVYYAATNVNLAANFIGNSAGGSDANHFNDDVTNVTFTGIYMDNTGSNVIFINNSVSGNVIRDSIFFNNAPIAVDSGSLSVIDVWFGNNVSDYDVAPDVGVDLDNWLFLNATVGPNPVSGVKSDIIFNLFRYDGGEVSSYDNSRLSPINLEITSEAGSVNKDLANLNENITYTPESLGNGTVTASFEGVVCTIEFDTRFSPKFKVIMIDGLKLTAVLTDQDGNPISGEAVFYAVDDEVVNATTDDNGEFVCDVKSNCVLTMSYVKNNEILCNASITLKNIKPVPKATVIEVPSTMKKTAVDYKAGEKGTMFYFYLKDADGKALANKAIKIGIFDKIYTVKTDSNGRGGLQINIANANYYTYGISFLGDDDYKASFAVCSLEIVKKSVTITPAKTSYSFKASAKTKTVTATLKSTNSYIPKGKQVTLTVAGKTFKATIGAKGQISFNIGSITKKGTYNVAIKFAGTNTYAAANSKTISIKIA